jgi:hypothetical protein
VQHRDGTSHVIAAQPAQSLEQLQGIVLKFRNDYLDSTAKSLDQQAAYPGLSDEQRNQILIRRHEITLRKKKPLEPLYDPPV